MLKVATVCSSVEVWKDITESDVLKIRNDKRTGSEIAKDYNIAFQTVSEIKNKKIWAWVS